MRKEVFEIVRKLLRERIYPSLPRARSALSPALPDTGRYSDLSLTRHCCSSAVPSGSEMNSASSCNAAQLQLERF
jgi:hypothetical protein